LTWLIRNHKLVVSNDLSNIGEIRKRLRENSVLYEKILCPTLSEKTYNRDKSDISAAFNNLRRKRIVSVVKLGTKHFFVPNEYGMMYCLSWDRFQQTYDWQYVGLSGLMELVQHSKWMSTLINNSKRNLDSLRHKRSQLHPTGNTLKFYSGPPSSRLTFSAFREGGALIGEGKLRISKYDISKNAIRMAINGEEELFKFPVSSLYGAEADYGIEISNNFTILGMIGYYFTDVRLSYLDATKDRIVAPKGAYKRISEMKRISKELKIEGEERDLIDGREGFRDKDIPMFIDSGFIEPYVRLSAPDVDVKTMWAAPLIVVTNKALEEKPYETLSLLESFPTAGSLISMRDSWVFMRYLERWPELAKEHIAVLEDIFPTITKKLDGSSVVFEID
jgi:hypothetical protein